MCGLRATVGFPHLYMLEVAAEQGFTFDTVQMPLNVMDAHYRSFEKLVLPELVKQRLDATASNPAWLGEEPERVQRVMPA